MFSLGKRRNAAPAAADPPPVEGSDDDPVTRACWLVVNALRDPLRTIWRGEPNTPFTDLALDLRAALVKTDAGRRVFTEAVTARGATDLIARLTADRDQVAAERDAALNDLASVRAERDEAARWHEEFVEALCRFVPQEWEARDGAAEPIVVDFVKTVTERLTALGGSLDEFVETGESEE